MRNLKLKIIIALLVSVFVFNFSLFNASPVSAHCPLCVAGAAVGVSLARYVGVDDSITGIWIGALLGALSFWLFNWLVSKKVKFIAENKLFFKPGIYSLVWGATLWSFYKFQLIIRMTQIFFSASLKITALPNFSSSITPAFISFGPMSPQEIGRVKPSLGKT